MNLSTRVVLSLLAGLGAGILVSILDVPGLTRFVNYLEPIGTLWLNALRMTVIPLVVGLLITGVASASETASTGRLALRALLLFMAFLCGAVLLSALLVPAMLTWLPVSAEAAQGMRAGASHAAVLPPMPPLREWFMNIVPTNPFEALTNGAMMPLVVFSLTFGFAAARIAPERRHAILAFSQAVVDTMFVIVHWVLRLAPLGVFVLALFVGMRGGVGAAGAIAHYLILVTGLAILVTLLLYPVASIALHIPLARFAVAAAPAQVVAFSTQSSLASMPAMLERLHSHLLVPRRVTALVMPLAVSLFRVTSPPMNLAIVIFCAHIYGVPLDPLRLIAGATVAVVTNFAVVGLPGQATFFTTTVPISLAMGVPIELLPLLLAVEVIPDIFRTVGNVTADMIVTAMAGRGEPRDPDAASPEVAA